MQSYQLNVNIFHPLLASAELDGLAEDVLYKDVYKTLVLALGEIAQYRGKLSETSEEIKALGGCFFSVAIQIIRTTTLPDNSKTCLGDVRISLLVGLYYDQLGRVLDSYPFIREACSSIKSMITRYVSLSLLLYFTLTEISYYPLNQREQWKIPNDFN